MKLYKSTFLTSLSSVEFYLQDNIKIDSPIICPQINVDCSNSNSSSTAINHVQGKTTISAIGPFWIQNKIAIFLIFLIRKFLRERQGRNTSFKETHPIRNNNTHSLPRRSNGVDGSTFVFNTLLLVCQVSVYQRNGIFQYDFYQL